MGDMKKRYCKHCYYRMKDTKNGRVDEYFGLFSDAQSGDDSLVGLDKDDMRMIQRLFRYCSLCPQCYRPYGVWRRSRDNSNAAQISADDEVHLETDRYDRHHVLLHVISCYFFLLLVWLPLVTFLALPALMSKLLAKATDSEHSGYAVTKQSDGGSFGDYHRSAQQISLKHRLEQQSADAFRDDDDDSSEEGESTDLQRMMFSMMARMNEMAEAQGLEGAKGVKGAEQKAKKKRKRKKTMHKLQQQQQNGQMDKFELDDAKFEEEEKEEEAAMTITQSFSDEERP